MVNIGISKICVSSRLEPKLLVSQGCCAGFTELQPKRMQRTCEPITHLRVMQEGSKKAYNSMVKQWFFLRRTQKLNAFCLFRVTGVTYKYLRSKHGIGSCKRK